jgi:hypothetical protein
MVHMRICRLPSWALQHGTSSIICSATSTARLIRRAALDAQPLDSVMQTVGSIRLFRLIAYRANNFL